MNAASMTSPDATIGEPSPWLLRWAHLIRPGGRVLDLACGRGRHLRWLVARGFSVTGVDRDAAALEPLRALSAELLVADLETGPWPLAGRRFDAVVVTNYLWRQLIPTLRAALDDGGVWIHETFAAGNETVGRPARPEFLLGPGELLHAAEGLYVVAYEDGFLSAPDRFVQRIVAVAPPGAGTPLPVRLPLAPAGEPKPGG
ncbi:MAG: methyltransferase domain-containing protein [Rubrivivax sp.]